MEIEKRKITIALVCGMLGCLCFGSGDWLMLYGDTAHDGSIYWLTHGTAQIPAWRNTLAMALAFPGIILYGIALFALTDFIRAEKEQKVYHTLTAFGLTPWIALHLFYIMILYAFSWLSAGSYAEAAPPLGEALFAHFSWVPLVSEILMLPPFLYWFYLQIRQKTVFPKEMAFTNILVIYFLMYGIKSMMPDGPFRIGFTNGLMSESMIIWFGIMLAWNLCRKGDVGHENGQRERNGY
ncbi:hypothetical protein D3Z47_18455 [Lachnospiraceae bacterium]|nr:hypothetical protein [Lachnospiraceae bacterium]